MDTVILAAGRGSRLAGTVPAYMKPLITVNGESLLRTLVRHASRLSERVVVVASPENTGAIGDLVGDDVTLVVQHTALGPGDALRRGLQATHSNDVLLLMGDNVVSYKDIAAVAEASTYAMGIRVLDHTQDDPERFTRVTEDGTLIEGTPGGQWQDGLYRCWIGPIRIPRDALYELPDRLPDCEIKISPYLPSGPKLIEVNVIDIGTPDALTNRLLHAQAVELGLSWMSEALLHAHIDLGAVRAVECQHPLCKYDARTFEQTSRQRQFTWDHEVPRRHEGDHTVSNLRPVHRGCNAMYRDRTEAQRKQYVQPEDMPHGDDHWTRRAPVERQCRFCDFVNNPGNVAQHERREHPEALK